MVSVSGYMECVNLHHVGKPQPHAVVYHLYTTLGNAISLIYHGMVLLISASSVVQICSPPCDTKINAYLELSVRWTPFIIHTIKKNTDHKNIFVHHQKHNNGSHIFHIKSTQSFFVPRVSPKCSG